MQYIDSGLYACKDTEVHVIKHDQKTFSNDIATHSQPIDKKNCSFKNK